MKTYSLEEVMRAAGGNLSGIAVVWSSKCIENRKGQTHWQEFDQFTYKNGYSTIVLTIGKGQHVPNEGDTVFIRCRRVITDEGNYVNYEVMNEIPEGANELSMEDFIKGNSPDVWDKTTADGSSDED